ncbi:major facilitator superfamily domain-containing protein [Trichoderma longibrachiatum]|uniref:MFS general substrate transporter n=1 Tax=Trichoderma longibrachiatum ATCC 18648 TaxID=983965 RepID=A0A2T4CHJ5_TRILO|nr:MFS general substrate transporter [Trichoderma longibrachiatum ATCC 18648]
MALEIRRPTVPTTWLLPLLVVNLFVINLGLSISDYPSTKLWQDIICKHYLGLTSSELLPERECHDRAVQRELNIVDIGSSVSSTIGSALVALPLGMLSDKLGRVPVLALSIASLFLSETCDLLICWQWRHVPLRALWASGAIMLLGGGRGVAEAMVFTSISDVIPESKRATCFQWVVASVLSSELFGPLIANRLTEISIWCPLLLELGLIAAGGLVLVLLMPETLPARNSPILVGEDTPTISNNNDTTINNNNSSKTTNNTTTMPTTEPSPSHTKSALATIFRRPAIYLLPGSILAMPAVTSQYGIVMRIMPLQFDWPLSRASLLFSLNAAVTLVTLLLLLPAASYLLYRHGDPSSSSSPLQRDRILARASVVLFVLGSLFLVVGGRVSLVVLGVAVSALGSGVPTLCRTLLIALVGEHRTGSVFGVIAAGEVLGMLACELIIGPLFDVGLRTWLGLPFCLGLVISMPTCVLTWLVRDIDV